MKSIPALILAATLFFQADPLAAAKKDLGSVYNVERVEPGILLAAPLDEPDAEPATFDHRAALLREALKRGTLPPLKTYFGMDLGTFHGRDVMSLHTSLALRFAEFLEKKGALKKFFEAYRKTFRKDESGAAAVEAALGGRLDAIEKEFAAHVKALPWLNEPRFL